MKIYLICSLNLLKLLYWYFLLFLFLSPSRSNCWLTFIFHTALSSSQNGSGSCDSKALIALSAILRVSAFKQSISWHFASLVSSFSSFQEHNGYSLAHLDEMMMLLHGVKSDLDPEWWVPSLLGEILNFSSWLVFVSKENMLSDMSVADVAAGKDMQGISWDCSSEGISTETWRWRTAGTIRTSVTPGMMSPDDDVRAMATEALILPLLL
jgi:hypothetical protein